MCAGRYLPAHTIFGTDANHLLLTNFESGSGHLPASRYNPLQEGRLGCARYQGVTVLYYSHCGRRSGVKCSPLLIVERCFTVSRN